MTVVVFSDTFISTAQSCFSTSGCDDAAAESAVKDYETVCINTGTNSGCKF